MSVMMTMINTVAVLKKAMQLHQQHKLDAAKALYQDILKQEKNNATAHNLLGAVLVAQKQFKLAEKHLLKAVKLAPKYASAHYNLGRCYLDQGLFQKAFGPVNKAVSLDANFTDAVFVLANIHIQLGQIKVAEAGYRKVVAQAPRHFEAWNNLGNALQEQNNSEGAVRCHKKAIEIMPKFQLAYVALATALKRVDENLAAIEILNHALQLEEHAFIYYKLGTNYQQVGQMQKAREAYLKAIDLDPSLGSCYRGFANTTKVSSAQEVGFIKDAFAITMNDNGRMHLNFAWATVQDSLANYSEAFAAYQAGNDLYRASFKYSSDKDAQLFKTIKQRFGADFISNSDSREGKGAGLVFILGMPRSGTTLVEQIIASHSLVTGAGELSYLTDFSIQYPAGRIKFYKQFPEMAKSEWTDLADSYLENISKLADGKPIVTDKMPHNFLNMGIIAKLLPEAKMVHCKRHPVANCLSIYKAYFSAKGSHKYAYNLQELGEYHNRYEDLMAHWRKVMPNQFHEIKYETLTTNQEEESRKLLDYCGLEWQDACLDFYKSKRKVKTASAFQVRQPMSIKSVDLWKHYGDALQPLIDVLHIPEEYLD